VSHAISTAEAIQEMVRFFLPHCSDQSTLRELDSIASDHREWRRAHALFSRIRAKNLKADAANDRLLQVQYSFEEICAKTLFNMSGQAAAFDEDSPFWVVPMAVWFARALGVADPYTVSSLLRPRGKAEQRVGPGASAEPEP
jgi:hypothetical protein